MKSYNLNSGDTDMDEKEKKSRSKASMKWKEKNYVRIPLDVRPEQKEQIKQAAHTAGMTVGGYIKQAISEKMNREEKP